MDFRELPFHALECIEQLLSSALRRRWLEQAAPDLQPKAFFGYCDASWADLSLGRT